MTIAEAERLAVARYRNYVRGTVAVSISIPGTTPALVDGLVDYREHVGFGSLTATPASGPSETIQIAWGPDTVAYAPLLVMDLSRWQTRPLGDQPVLDTALAIVLNLAADRPENAQLLQQSSARFFGQVTENGATADVFSGPVGAGAGLATATATASAPSAAGQTSSTTTESAAPQPRTRYFLDGQGQLLRFDIVSPGSQPIVLRFPQAATTSGATGASTPAKGGIPSAIVDFVKAGPNAN